MYALSDYNYELPPELIAQKPVDQRDQSNLLVMNRETGDLSHHRFNMLDAFLSPGDALVVNNTAVIPGRLVGRKDSGGRVEVLICSFSGNGSQNRSNKAWLTNVWLKPQNLQNRAVAFTLMMGLRPK